MMVFLNWLLSALLIVILLPVLVLFLQVVLAYLPARSKPSSPLLRPRVAVLVPAHNESSVITATLNSLLPQLREGDRLLVVADNCTDDTAVLVRAAGAEVAERSNEQQRGKGYALDFGITDEGKTLLVEVSDGYALASFGLKSRLYMQILLARWQELTKDVKV